MNSSSCPIGSVNWIGTWTLYKREVWRFLKVGNQTLLAPVVTTLLFLAVLTLALGGAERSIEGIGFGTFVSQGLVMMAVVQNAFANTSSSLMLSKIQGVIVDILMPPLTGGEITFSLVMGGVTRGVLVCITVLTSVAFFVPMTMAHPLLMLFFVISASMLLALLGVLAGVFSQSFDQMAAITNYFITPLSFLSGTFYSVNHLPETWRTLCLYNPFFYMIDGFRYSLNGFSDGSVGVGIAVMIVCNIGLWLLVQHLITRGTRLKT